MNPAYKTKYADLASVMAALDAFATDATASEHAAREALSKTGIYTKSGQVSAEYGGLAIEYEWSFL